ncbi:MAG: family glycosyltransferase, partial [Chloroflexi bacterium]|nr:family glycosyltransferase [Chloroflexota bacterium]
MDFIDGTNYSSRYLLNSHRLRLIAVSGTSLGRFHRSMAGFLPGGRHHLGFAGFEGKRRRDLDWHLEKLDELNNKELPKEAAESDREILAMLARRSAEISERLSSLEGMLAPVDFPRLVIHGDFGLHNLLFKSDGNIALIDFELARLEWRLSDLVITLPRLRASSQAVFLKAYHTEFPLSSDEWHYLPEVWQLRMLQGAVQYWNNYFELGDNRRLAGARQRLEQADWAGNNRSDFLNLRYVAARDASERPLRVWMVARLFYPWIGGAERQAHKLAQQLLKKDVNTEIVTGWWFRNTPRQQVLDGVQIYRNHTLWEFFGVKGLRKLGGYLYILTLAWHLGTQRGKYDIIHVHGLNYHTYAAVISRPWHKHKVLVKLANSEQASDIKKMRRGQQLAFSRFMLPAALQCDKFVALNRSIRSELQEEGVPADRILELGNGVETSQISVKKEYALQNPVRIIFVGRLHEQKGLEILLNAFQMLQQKHAPGTLILQLLGDGPLRNELARLAEQLGIAGQVQFAGQVGDVADYLEHADVFVLPSRAEGISNALLEAMATGLPVIASNIPGNQAVIEDGMNGLLFAAGDPVDLENKLTNLLSDRSQRQRLGEAAAISVDSRFSIAAIADHYIETYKQLLTKSK